MPASGKSHPAGWLFSQVESANGAFQAYISCDLPAGALKNLKPAAIAVTKQGKLTRLACIYPEGILFTHRTKAQCKVQGDGRADPAGQSGLTS